VAVERRFGTPTPSVLRGRLPVAAWA